MKWKPNLITQIFAHFRFYSLYFGIELRNQSRFYLKCIQLLIDYLENSYFYQKNNMTRKPNLKKQIFAPVHFPGYILE